VTQGIDPGRAFDHKMASSSVRVAPDVVQPAGLPQARRRLRRGRRVDIGVGWTN
jgi:hypothetical protein